MEPHRGRTRMAPGPRSSPMGSRCGNGKRSSTSRATSRGHPTAGGLPSPVTSSGGQGIFIATLGRSGAKLITDPALKAIDPGVEARRVGHRLPEPADRDAPRRGPGRERRAPAGGLPHTASGPTGRPTGALIATMAWVRDPADPENEQTEIFTSRRWGDRDQHLARSSRRLLAVLVARRVPARLGPDPRGRIGPGIHRRGPPSGPNVVEIRIDADLAPRSGRPTGRASSATSRARTRASKSWSSSIPMESPRWCACRPRGTSATATGSACPRATRCSGFGRRASKPDSRCRVSGVHLGRRIRRRRRLR